MSTDRQPRLVALRGATTATEDSPEAISAATVELLEALFERNRVTPGDVVSIFFTSTPDLTSSYPAEGARTLGLGQVPLLCALDAPVEGSVERCIRVLVHLYRSLEPASLRHAYLRGARGLREDLSE